MHSLPKLVERQKRVPLQQLAVAENDVNYTDHVIRDVLVNGMYDPDIRREILSQENLPKTSINDVIALVETREMARNALPSSVSAISSFQRQRQTTTRDTFPTSTERQKQSLCPDCKQTYHLFSEGPKGWNTKPHHVYLSCYRL